MIQDDMIQDDMIQEVRVGRTFTETNTAGRSKG